MLQIFRVPTLFSNGETATDQALVVETATGMITARYDWAALPPEQPRQAHSFPEHWAMVPGFANTHIHTFQSLLKGVADDCDFFTWRKKALYRYATKLTPDDLYVGALFAFAETLLCGTTTVCDFFYIHDQANDNALGIIRAARDLGLRVVMARTLYDWDGAPTRFIESPDVAVSNTRQLIAHVATDPYVSVLPAPHSLHGASLPLIQAGEALSRELNVPFHMHVAEGEYERQIFLDREGLSPVQYLAKQGILNNRLVMIHAVWVDEADIASMGQAQCSVAYNPSSNMFLGDGITPLIALENTGVTITLGTDGGCSNNRASVIEEMRMASLLQKVTHRNSTVTTARQMLRYGTHNAARVLNLPIGSLTPGHAADFTLINRHDLSMLPDSDWVSNFIYSSQPQAIQQVYVGGQCIMTDGDLVRMPVAKIIEKIQACWQRLQ